MSTKNYSGKIAFACAMVAVALFSRAAYPRLYSIAQKTPASPQHPRQELFLNSFFPLSLEAVSGVATSVNPDGDFATGSRAQ